MVKGARIFGLVASLWAGGAQAIEPLPEALVSPLSAPRITAPTWAVVDFNSGYILAGQGIDERIEPASLTKLLTSYIVFMDLQQGAIRLGDTVRISQRAWAAEGSRTFIEVGSEVAIEDLLRGLIIQSGNDASIALAEHIGGSEETFALRMNLVAEQLGMHDSHFINSSGLPGREHYSTLGDMLRLSVAMIRDFPEYYPYYSEESFTYNDITQPNRNGLLGVEDGVDGLKTGFTERAGYGLIASAERDGRRVLAAALGTDSAADRVRQVRTLLGFAYTAYDTQQVTEPDEPLAQVPLWYGQEDQADIGVREAFYVVYPKGRQGELNAVLQVPSALDAPLSTEQSIGQIQIEYAGTQLGERPLYPLFDYPEGSVWMHPIDWIRRQLARF